MNIRKILSYCLFPLTMWYGIVVFIRNLLFDLGVLKQQSPNIATIGIGNLACGGTGKTPHVEYLLKLLSEQHTTAMLSRGYRRTSKGFQMDDGTHNTAMLGDEAAMVATKFPKVRVAVCNNRMEGIKKLQEAAPDLQLVVLDDSFQHRFIQPALNILLTDYNHPFFNDHIIPFGDLRESRRGLSRANIIIVSKSPEKLDPVTRHNITNAIGGRTYQKVFFSYVKYGDLVPLFGGASHPVADFKNILCVTGIAHPQPLYDHLGETANVQPMTFNDHHLYKLHDIQDILKQLDQLPPEKRCIVTTDKDAARLRSSDHADLLREIPIYSISIEVAFHNNGDYSFDNEVSSIVKENIIFQQRLKNCVYITKK